MGKYSFGKTSSDQLAEIHPVLRELAYKAIELSTVDFGVPVGGGLRTAEQQRVSYDLGYSKCDGVKKKSKHQTGLAVDLVPYLNGKYTWDNIDAFKSIYAAVMEAWLGMKNKEFTLSWGGNWKGSWDKPHYELTKVK